MTPLFRLPVLLLTLLPLATLAADEAPQENHEIYVCDVSSVHELNDAGELSDSNFAKAVKMYESRFAVDRATGAAMGGPFGTWDAKHVQVLNPGNDKEGFKVLWLANTAYTHLKYLSVKAYIEGDKKPFVGISGNVVITGTCE